MSDRSSKKQKAPEKAKAKKSEELSEEQLEKVAGGAFDAFTKFQGVEGETQNPQGTPTESMTLNFGKISTKYVKQ
jgi:hypothetical protein